ncbi:MAG: ubiquinone/menaquinone biosynthesis C-methylase UbiE [Planctomycetota bacterium]|jgi:ubiquinone/menaquinone biosynthesis C-methylase UbiE
MINRKSLKAIKPIYTSYQAYKYLVFQLELAREELRDWKNNRNEKYLPVPPARLRHRVHGRLDRESFLRRGKNLARNIRDLCTTIDHDIYSFEHVLDFGCGSGRVIRNFLDAPASCQLYGTDIDSESISWCEKYLPQIQWETNGYQPPLPFPDNSFDLIYSISVFSHLDEEFQHSWLRELRRVARPGATLILSVHGEYCINKLAPSDQNHIHPHGFMFLTGATGRLKLDKLPDFYQTAFHTQDYIHREWSAYFDVVRYVERGINNHQDAVLLRKPIDVE